MKFYEEPMIEITVISDVVTDMLEPPQSGSWEEF